MGEKTETITVNTIFFYLQHNGSKLFEKEFSSGKGHSSLSRKIIVKVSNTVLNFAAILLWKNFFFPNLMWMNTFFRYLHL